MLNRFDSAVREGSTLPTLQHRLWTANERGFDASKPHVAATAGDLLFVLAIWVYFFVAAAYVTRKQPLRPL